MIIFSAEGRDATRRLHQPGRFDWARLTGVHCAKSLFVTAPREQLNRPCGGRYETAYPAKTMPPEFSAAFELPASVADWTAEPSSRNSSIQRINDRIPDSTWLPVVCSIPAHTTGIRIQPPTRVFHPKWFVPRLSGGSAATVAEPDHPGTTWASACSQHAPLFLVEHPHQSAQFPHLGYAPYAVRAFTRRCSPLASVGQWWRHHRELQLNPRSF